jgi:hypothetical protein
MKKPIDPRNHGLKEPKKMISKVCRISPKEMEGSNISGWNWSESIKLRVLTDTWEKLLKEHLSRGEHIATAPSINSDFTMEYTIEWTNLNYFAERAEFDLAILTYEDQKKVYDEWDAKRKLIPASPPNLDQKIAKTQRRLANLLAHKEGKTLPYPNNNDD